jgi:hypothetical protein
MARLPGDEAAALELYLRFDREIRGTLIAVARQIGLHRLDDDDLDALTFDACQLIGRLAGGWRPDGGALPWTWAKARLGNLIHAHVGQPYERFDEAVHDVEVAAAGAADDPEPAVVLAALAEDDPRCALVLDALSTALPERDIAIFLRYASSHDGSRAPSHQVAAETGLAPPAVRKVASRARRRLRAVVAADPRFASLSDLPLLGDRQVA